MTVDQDRTAQRRFRWKKTGRVPHDRNLAPPFISFDPSASLLISGSRRQRRRLPGRRQRLPPRHRAVRASVSFPPFAFHPPHLSRPQRPDPAPQATPARRARAERRAGAARRAVAGPLRAIHFPLPTSILRERRKQRESAGLPHSFSARVRVRGQIAPWPSSSPVARPPSAVSAPPSRDLAAVLALFFVFYFSFPASS